MRSHEAIQTAISGKTIEHAKALRLASSSVHKWQEPSIDFTDSGSLNPLDRIETVIQTSLNLGTDPEKAMAPLYYLAERFNQITISLPTSDRCTKELTKELLQMIEEFSDLTKEVSDTLEDGEVRRSEAKRVDKAGWILIRTIAELVTKMNEAAR